jgi:hypothetical protein
MPLWITCVTEGDVRTLATSASHDVVHQRLDEVLVEHSKVGRRIRNVLRGDGEPAWDVVDNGGSVLATYWISRGSGTIHA